MNKIWPGYGEKRDAENDFRWKYKDHGIRQRWRKYCRAAANKFYYQINKQVYLERAHIRNSHVIELS